MKLQPVIGLETHVQLKTASKMFSASSNNSTKTPPNTNISAIDLGHPGTLPTPNYQAVKWAIMFGLALHGEIIKESKFDRKHYFYPDLPKGYQISQFDQPIMSDGFLDVILPNGEHLKQIRIERLHLEEDAAKNIHGEDGKTYIDYNRAGSPLCEIVTKPDFTTAQEAKLYLQEIRLLARTLGISDADMEKGQLRCDVNISMRKVNDDGTPIDNILHPKTEIKNVNSFKAVERVIEYEIQRQTKLWETNSPPAITTTRGWNDAQQITEEQRTKEDSADYRFLPEPDMPPMNLVEITEEIKRKMPEMPWDKRIRFVSEYGFKLADVQLIIENPKLADFTEHAISELGAWLNAQPDIDPETMPQYRKKLVKLFSTWLLTKLGGLLTEKKIDLKIMKITPENFAEFIILLAEKKITATNGLTVLGKMLESGEDPSHIVEDMGMSRMDNAEDLQLVITDIIENNPNETERYKNGEVKLLQFFIGQVMRETKGSADVQIATKIIKTLLK